MYVLFVKYITRLLPTLLFVWYIYMYILVIKCFIYIELPTVDDDILPLAVHVYIFITFVNLGFVFIHRKWKWRWGCLHSGYPRWRFLDSERNQVLDHQWLRIWGYSSKICYFAIDYWYCMKYIVRPHLEFLWPITQQEGILFYCKHYLFPHYQKMLIIEEKHTFGLRK